MPKELKRKLRRQGIKKGLSGERLSHYIYGTLAKIKKKKRVSNII